MTSRPPAEPGSQDDQRIEPSDHVGYGFPSGLWRSLAERPPPGVKLVQRWRSPLRGLWLTSVLGSVLLVMLPIVIITGLLSYIAYGPQFGQAIPGDVGWLKLPTFDWPTEPAWIYRLNQGLHVGLGLILIPIVLAKLWSVIPRLFTWPPARSIAQVLERISLLTLVGGMLFEIITGVLNIQYDYIFGFSFYTAHYYGAWVFIAGFVVHIAIKIPKMWTGLRSMSMRKVLHTSRADTVAEPYEPDGLVAESPTAPTISRRGALALVGGGALFIAVITAGQTLGGFTRKAALLLPRGRTRGDGPNDFQVNRTARAAGITPELTGATWRLTLTGGPSKREIDLATLRAMPQHTARLPIACVEGWSTTQEWTGVQLSVLAERAGAPGASEVLVESLQPAGVLRRASLTGAQIAADDALLALRVNGADLSMDHGFPARVIVPALPGVHNTKWVAQMTFRRA